MLKKKIKQLAQASFKGKNLDERRINLVASKLKRKDLRFYLKELTLLKQQGTVEVYLSSDVDDQIKNQVQIRFPQKDIVYTIDKDLLAGMRIVDNDILIDLSLQDIIERLVTNIYETND